MIIKTLFLSFLLHVCALAITLAPFIPCFVLINFITSAKRGGGPTDDIFCHLIGIASCSTVFCVIIARILQFGHIINRECQGLNQKNTMNRIKFLFSNTVCFLGIMGFNTLEQKSYFSLSWLAGVYCKGICILLSIECWKRNLAIISLIFTSIEKYIDVPSLRSIVNGDSTISVEIGNGINIQTSSKNKNQYNHSSGMFDTFLSWIFIDKNFYKFVFQTCFFKFYFFLLKFVDFVENEQYLCLMLSWINWDYGHPWNHAHSYAHAIQCQQNYDDHDKNIYVHDHDHDKEKSYFESRYRNPMDPNLNLLALRHNVQWSYPKYPCIHNDKEFERMIDNKRGVPMYMHTIMSLEDFVKSDTKFKLDQVWVPPIDKVYVFYDHKLREKIGMLFLSLDWHVMWAMKWVCYLLHRFILDKKNVNSVSLVVYFILIGLMYCSCHNTKEKANKTLQNYNNNNDNNNNSMCKDVIEKNAKMQQKYLPCIRIFSFCSCILPSKYRPKMSEIMFEFYFDAMVVLVMLFSVIFTNDNFELHDYTLFLISILIVSMFTLFFACVNMTKLIYVVTCQLCFTALGSIVTFPLLILGFTIWSWHDMNKYSYSYDVNHYSIDYDYDNNFWCVESILLMEKLLIKILFSNCRIILLLSWILIINIAIGRDIYDLMRLIAHGSYGLQHIKTNDNKANYDKHHHQSFELSSFLLRFWDNSRIKTALLSLIFMKIGRIRTRRLDIWLMPLVVWLYLIVDDTNKIDMFWICLLMSAHNACRLELSYWIFDQSYRNIFLMIKKRNKRLKILKSKRKTIKVAKKCIDSIGWIQQLQSILTKQIIIECCPYCSVDICMIIWQYLYYINS